jgi:peptidoglycan/LPS O-acetylase OafA/YrhL
VLGLFVASLAVAFIFPTYHLEWFGGGILGRIFGYPFFWAMLLPNYLAGVVAWRYRDKLVVSDRVAMMSAIALAVSIPVANSWSVMFPVCGAYLVLWAAFHPLFRLHGFSKYGDFSYGMYLYAFPIQQLLVMHNSGSMNPYALFALAWPLSILAGMLSWYVVERPFLRRARSMKNKSEDSASLTVVAQPT